MVSLELFEEIFKGGMPEYYVEKIDRKEFFDDYIKTYIERAKISLANTPNILPVLKEAGVVDSGGAGFLKVADAMMAQGVC